MAYKLSQSHLSPLKSSTVFSKLENTVDDLNCYIMFQSFWPYSHTVTTLGGVVWFGQNLFYTL